MPPRSPRVSRDGRFYWDEQSQTWLPLPPGEDRKRHRGRSGGISAGTVILLIILYLVFHAYHYSGCLMQPSLLSWPAHCPFPLP